VGPSDRRHGNALGALQRWLPLQTGSVCALLVTVSLAATDAQAGCGCGDWADLSAPLDVCLADALGRCVTPLTEAAELEVERWRAFVALWQPRRALSDLAAPRDGAHTVALRTVADLERTYGATIAPWVLGVTFAPNVLGLQDGNATCPLPDGVTCPTYGDAPQNDVDVVLVADRTFTTDGLRAWRSHVDGNVAPVWDARQVLAHELGHALGLRHEARGAALMNPFHLEFPGVVPLADDVAAARAHVPRAATQVSDLAVVGFTVDDRGLWGVFLEADGDGLVPLVPGRDRFRVSDFTVSHRGTRAAPGVVTEVRVGEAVAGSLVCDLPASGDCPLLEAAEFVVPPVAGGRQVVSLRVVSPGGEARLDDNTLVLGTLEIAGSAVDAAVVDAAVADAAVEPEDARRADAALDLRPLDADKSDGVAVDDAGPASPQPDAVAASGAVRSADTASSGCAQTPPRAPGGLVFMLLTLGTYAARRRLTARRSDRS
jgi:hypothetical protein